MGIRRNHYDVSNRVFVADPRTVCRAVCEIVGPLAPQADLRPLRRAFELFGRLYAGLQPGYHGCETWYHDAQHSLDCALAMTRLMDGYERTAARPYRLGGGRLLLGVIAALFHDAGYIRSREDSETHGAELTLSHVGRGGELLERLLPQLGLPAHAELARPLLHFTGFEVPLDGIEVRHPLDRLLGHMLGSADVLAQLADRCYLEKCRDFLYDEFAACGLAGAGSRALYASREELLSRTPEFRDRLWSERLDGCFKGVYRHAADHFGGGNLYVEAIDRQLRWLEQALRKGEAATRLRRRPAAVNAEPLRRLLGAGTTRVEAKSSGYRRLLCQGRMAAQA